MRSAFTLIAAASALGCTSADHMERPAARDWSGAVEHASLLRSATLDHHDAILASSDLSAVLVEEERYRREAEAHLGMMGREIDRMGSCMNASGRIPDTSTLLRLRNLCGDTLSRHVRAMTEAPDLAHAHAEEAHYHDVMMRPIDDAIDEGRGMMMEMGSGASCMEGGGMHGPMMP